MVDGHQQLVAGGELLAKYRLLGLQIADPPVASFQLLGEADFALVQEFHVVVAPGKQAPLRSGAGGVSVITSSTGCPVSSTRANAFGGK